MSAFTPTATPIDVHRWLVASGWQIGQARFYEHVKEGKLSRDSAGQFTERAVLKYARAFLRRADTGRTIEDDDAALSREKLTEETALKRVQREREQFRLDVERGRYVLRDTIEMELAGRAVALEAGFDHMVYTRAAEWVALVKGDQSRADQLITALLAAKDQWLNSYAAATEFAVVLKKEEACGKGDNEPC